MIHKLKAKTETDAIREAKKMTPCMLVGYVGDNSDDAVYAVAISSDQDEPRGVVRRKRTRTRATAFIVVVEDTTREVLLESIQRRICEISVDALADLSIIVEKARPDDLIDWAHALRTRGNTFGF